MGEGGSVTVYVQCMCEWVINAESGDGAHRKVNRTHLAGAWTAASLACSSVTAPDHDDCSHTAALP